MDLFHDLATKRLEWYIVSTGYCVRDKHMLENGTPGFIGPNPQQCFSP